MNLLFIECITFSRLLSVWLRASINNTEVWMNFYDYDLTSEAKLLQMWIPAFIVKLYLNCHRWLFLSSSGSCSCNDWEIKRFGQTSLCFVYVYESFSWLLILYVYNSNFIPSQFGGILIQHQIKIKNISSLKAISNIRMHERLLVLVFEFFIFRLFHLLLSLVLFHELPFFPLNL
jgi:hypothetical protein